MKALCAIHSASGGSGRGIERGEAITLLPRPDFERSELEELTPRYSALCGWLHGCATLFQGHNLSTSFAEV